MKFATKSVFPTEYATGLCDVRFDGVKKKRTFESAVEFPCEEDVGEFALTVRLLGSVVLL